MSTTEAKKRIFEYLELLGIKKSDTLLVNINLFKIGKLPLFTKQDYINAFLDFLGPEGTLVSLTYTNSKFTFFNQDIPFFDGSQKANTGAFANIMLNDDRSLRSGHPTHSVAAIGPKAKFITSGIDHNSYCFEPIYRLIKLKGKILLIGMDDYPGFITHAVQENMGLSARCWMGYFNKVITPKGLFKIHGSGGCSKNFFRLYPIYKERNALHQTNFFSANALSIDAADAFTIDKEILSQSPYFLSCDDFKCTYCSIGNYNQIWKIPFFLIYKLFSSPNNFIRFFNS